VAMDLRSIDNISHNKLKVIEKLATIGFLATHGQLPLSNSKASGDRNYFDPILITSYNTLMGLLESKFI
jgi:hypothetical protein